jgi:phage terminase small subunit
MRVGELKNSRQELFAQNVAKGMPAYEAYLEAGYKPNTKEETTRGCASRLRSNAIIAARILELQKKGTEKALVEIADVVKGFLRIANADIGDAFDEHGKLKPIHEIPKELRLAMNGIDIEEIIDRQTGALDGYTKKFKLAEKTKALEALGRYLKMFTDKVEHTGTFTIEQLIVDSNAYRDEE